jgi:ubiquitin-protein ligase
MGPSFEVGQVDNTTLKRQDNTWLGPRHTIVRGSTYHASLHQSPFYPTCWPGAKLGYV